MHIPDEKKLHRNLRHVKRGPLLQGSTEDGVYVDVCSPSYHKGQAEVCGLC